MHPIIEKIKNAIFTEDLGFDDTSLILYFISIPTI